MTYLINNKETKLHFWAEQLRQSLMDYYSELSGNTYHIEHYVKIYNALLKGEEKTIKGITFSIGDIDICKN